MISHSFPDFLLHFRWIFMDFLPQKVFCFCSDRLIESSCRPLYWWMF